MIKIEQSLFSRKNIRKIWLNVHLMLALTIGFLFVILGLTGSFNVFNHELEELGLPQAKGGQQLFVARHTGVQ